MVQLSLFSYTRTVTRRIIDMVSMQAQLLMVTSVYEDEVSHDFDNRDLVADLREAIRALSPKEFENIMIVNAEREKRWKNLRNNIHANETILKLLKEGGIGTDHGGVNTLTGEFWRN